MWDTTFPCYYMCRKIVKKRVVYDTFKSALSVFDGLNNKAHIFAGGACSVVTI
jgi:hypothetical protein